MASGVFGGRAGYIQVTRTFYYSIVFVFPLFVIYEVGIWLVNVRYPIRNGADVILHEVLYSFGDLSFYGLGALVLATSMLQFERERRRYRLKLKSAYLVGMLTESAVYAFLLGNVSSALTRALLPGLSILPLVGNTPSAPTGLFPQIILSIGAGLYEEILFRVLLVSGVFTLLGWLAKKYTLRTRYIAAALIAAFIFSAFHYVGAYAYDFTIESFTFRLMAGLLLNGLYLSRGFGIAVWTHALYDILVTLHR